MKNRLRAWFDGDLSGMEEFIQVSEAPDASHEDLKLSEQEFEEQLPLNPRSQMIERLGGYPQIYFALGIHPKHVCPRRGAKERPGFATMVRLRERLASKVGLLDELSEQLGALEKLAKTESRIVAIGEAGLDYSHGPDSFEREVQAAVFMLQVEMSLRLRLPLVLHVRDAHDDAVAVLRRYHGAARGVVHCFSAGEREAREYLELGLSLGIGGRVTHEAFAGVRAAVAAAPADRLLLETDAPYVLPRDFGRDRNDSTAIPLIAREVAALRGVSVDEVARVTAENAERMFWG